MALYVVARFGKACMPSAVRTTEKLPPAFDPVADDFAAAMFAHGSKLMDRTFEAVKHVPLTRSDHFEAEFVFVTAHLACCHSCETRAEPRACQTVTVSEHADRVLLSAQNRLDGGR